MTKKRTDPEQSMETILNAALSRLRARGAADVTVSSVAEAAGCAKGLVHYHFKTKQNLWEAAARHLAAQRSDAWAKALAPASPADAVSDTWTLLTRESEDGTVLAWESLAGPSSILADQVVREIVAAFGESVGRASATMFTRLGVRLRVPAAEVGWLVASLVTGMGSMLQCGVERRVLENAYAAAWIGILSLTE